MSLYIPSWLLDLHEKYVDDMLNSDLGVNCQVLYLPKMTPCANCLINPIGNKSSNIHRTGGPVPFPQNSTCPMCNGQGYKQEIVIDNLVMQIYTNPKDWVDIGVKIRNPDGLVQCKGFMSDWPKMRNANQIKINIDIPQYMDTTYVLFGEGIAHGFRNNRYFLTFIKRT